MSDKSPFNLTYLTLSDRVISCAYDNKIKVSDFLSMENICLIDGPDQFTKKNIELR